MLYFQCDYNTFGHPLIMKRMQEMQKEAYTGYGTDTLTESAKKKIAGACGVPADQVFFVNGGTQANVLVIDTMLAPYEGVVSADTGHVNMHESGAVEFTGHKVLHVPQHLGKIDPGELDGYLAGFWADPNQEHMVFPGMVYISHPTEYGTLYSKDEITAISGICRRYGIPLFMDGARLGYGLMSRNTDVTLEDVAELTDVFYIGGTKVGAMLGEALVFTKNNMPKHFLTRVKQHTALLAKGFLLGLQFDTLFTDDLYFAISRNAIDRAEEVKAGFAERGVPFFLDSPTNQQFVILENAFAARLSERVVFEVWEPAGPDHTVYRFATSWATTKEDVEALFGEVDALL